jgi:PAS domain-containing protein
MHMREPQSRSRKTSPGMRALKACGDGLWEFDLLAGSAWFSDWFYRKLCWPLEAKRTLRDLQPLLQPAGWEELMRKIRAHLERGLPLDLTVRVELPADQIEWWHVRGAALRNEAGQPVYLAGAVRDASADRKPADASPSLLCLRTAFDEFPVAAALLDARHAVLKANRKWYEYAESAAVQAIGQLQAANPQSEVSLDLDADTGAGGGTRRLRVRAVPFQYAGLRHLVATLEDR